MKLFRFTYPRNLIFTKIRRIVLTFSVIIDLIEACFDRKQSTITRAKFKLGNNVSQ